MPACLSHFLRTVWTEKEIVTKISTLGFPLFYTAESYARSHGGRTPQEDGLTLEKMTMPNGAQVAGVKAGQP